MSSSAVEIHRLMDDRVKAVRSKNIDALASSHAADVLAFDVVNPLQSIGPDATRKRLEEWFSSFRGPIGFDIGELTIAAGEDVAFCHGLSHVNGTKADGGEIDMWYRTTVCFRKLDGRWIITHEHNSVPFNVESGKASLDLRP
jgi:ketosteroid isomerase-like protein